MRLLVVSDLHIRGSEDPLYASLLKLIESRTQPGDVLVLAGDVFDLYVGSKAVFQQRYQSFHGALRDAGVRGVEIHYIEGNHDFLIHGDFAGIAGLTVHSHEVKLELAGKRFYIAHGDTVDSSDIGYRALRLFFRSPLMKGLVAVTPGKWLDRIGQGSSRKSRGSKPTLVSELPLERAEDLRRRYRNYAAERITEGFDYVILGHCHDLDEMRFTLGERRGQYLNVGYPRIHGSFLSWEPGDPWIAREGLQRGNAHHSDDHRVNPTPT